MRERRRFNCACPTCDAPKGQHCRSLTTNRVTDTHQGRYVWAAIFGEVEPPQQPCDGLEATESDVPTPSVQRTAEETK